MCCFLSLLHSRPAGALFLCLLTSTVQSARADDPTHLVGNVELPAERTQVNWSDPGLIMVENALLKTIESTKIAAEVAGRIAQLDVAEGDLVKSNQVLGKIDDRSVRLQVQRAKLATAIARHKSASQIDLQLAEKRASVAKNELERAEAANAKVSNSYPTKELDRLRLVLDTATLEIERAQHDQTLLGLEAALMENDQKMAEELLARHQIIAPGNGMVISFSKHRGEWVEPGMELLEIVKLDRLRVEGFISAAHAGEPLVQRQAVIQVQSAEQSQILPAKLVFIYPEINPVNNQMRVHLEVENSQGLLSPGMRVRAAVMPLTP